MRRRDWAGTVLVACLIALAGLLRDHEVVVGLLLAAAVVSAVVIAWDRKLTRERGRRRPTGVRAGHGIRAGGNIESDAGIDAGWGIEAGGNIQQATLSRVDLLREQYSKGRELQRRLVVAGGLPETPEQVGEAEDQARHEACTWGRGAWRVIADYFPGYEGGFFGAGHLALGDIGFDMACQQEVERMGSSADTYLEGKLNLIAELLRKYDS
jgi:hypothetical protein